jgi:hypothetical protein
LKVAEYIRKDIPFAILIPLPLSWFFTTAKQIIKEIN